VHLQIVATAVAMNFEACSRVTRPLNMFAIPPFQRLSQPDPMPESMKNP
jgi:hypothetical protein